MKNKILIYFIFYINNISFLTKTYKYINTQVAKNEKEKKIQDNNIEEIKSDNNKDILSKKNNEDITSKVKKKKDILSNEDITSKIKKKKDILSNEDITSKIKKKKDILSKKNNEDITSKIKNKKDIWLIIIIGFIFSRIIFLLIQKEEIESEEQILKKLEERPIRKKTEEEIENLNFITNFIKNNNSKIYINLYIKEFSYYFNIDETKIDKFLKNIDTYFNSFEVTISNIEKQNKKENEIKEIYLFFNFKNSFLEDLILKKVISYSRNSSTNYTYTIYSLEIEEKEQIKIIKNLIKEYCTQDIYVWFN